jgi:iron complex transport system ATP-binding protein
MSLNAKNISFAYHTRMTLNDISLSLRAGEFLGLLGPNGSGKSTFLKTLLGFLKPCQGQIVFAGDNAIPDPRERSRRISFVPQTSHPPAALTVRELILMGRLPHIRDRWAGYGKEDRRLVAEVLRALDIEDMADRDVSCLSGGERQKAVIGRCLVQEGDILLLDEATSGLDLNHTIEIMELMRKKTGDEGKTIVAVLHDINLAAQYCDRIVLFKGGRLRYQGKPAEILTEKVVEEIYGIRVVLRADEYGRPFVLPRRLEDSSGNGIGKGNTGAPRGQEKQQKGTLHVY